MKLVEFGKKYWWFFALILIFLFSYHIRAINIVPDRLLSFDPIFQYRLNKYLVDWGHLPLWDELTYYVGRKIEINTSPPFMLYITTVAYWFLKDFGLSLMTVAAYMSAFYGAIIIFPVFLLGRKLSNKYGGLLAAILIGTAPQILVRTFGSSYDTDQMVLFFMILTLYLGISVLKERKVSKFCLATIGFIGFMLTWGYFLYTFMILITFVIIYLLQNIFLGSPKYVKFTEKLRASLSKFKNHLIVLIVLFLCLFIVGYINGINIFDSFLELVGFAQHPETWIVNISIAELQPLGEIWIPLFSIIIVSIIVPLIFFRKDLDKSLLLPVIFLISMILLFMFSASNYNNLSAQQRDSINFLDYLNGYIQSISVPLGRFLIGVLTIDILILLSFLSLISYAILTTYKKDLFKNAYFLTLFLIGFYTMSRGIRFTEFTSALFVILIGCGLGYFIDWSLKREQFLRSFSVGLCLLLTVLTIGISLQMSQGLGPDINPNWDEAWKFLRTKTPENSLIGTWWDPGHMINGIAERRNIGDGAHCHNQCLYTINDRIRDLGKIMATENENESLQLIRKYQGNSPKVYWIASDDLIGKWRWPQYFGTGCDGTVDPKCPLYFQLSEQYRSTDAQGNIIMRSYGPVILYQNIPILIQGIDAALFDEMIYYDIFGNVTTLKLNETEKQNLLIALRPLETQLNVRFTNESAPFTVWIPRHYSYLILIPQNQRNTIFTKMFFLEGQELEHFKQVFRNEQVKIYEIT